MQPLSVGTAGRQTQAFWLCPLLLPEQTVGIRQFSHEWMNRLGKEPETMPPTNALDDFLSVREIQETKSCSQILV